MIETGCELKEGRGMESLNGVGVGRVGAPDMSGGGGGGVIEKGAPPPGAVSHQGGGKGTK
jgi:hypothetical protein